MLENSHFPEEMENVNGTLEALSENKGTRMAGRPRAKSHRDLFTYAADNRPSVVYLATNLVNGKRYIGITRCELRTRIAQHFCQAKKGSGCRKFYRAIRKHGRQAFEFSVVAECATYTDAAREEMRLIAELKPEYNISPGGDGVGGIGQRASNETRKRLSESHKGQPGYWTGKKRAPETIEKMRETRLAGKPVTYWLGKKRSEETKQKIRATKATITVYDNVREAAKVRRKWVLCLNDGSVHHGTIGAAKAYGLRERSVGDVCRGAAKSLRGYRFKYVGEPTDDE